MVIIGFTVGGEQDLDLRRHVIRRTSGRRVFTAGCSSYV
jgi:hypothetical protein